MSAPDVHRQPCAHTWVDPDEPSRPHRCRGKLFPEGLGHTHQCLCGDIAPDPVSVTLPEGYEYESIWLTPSSDEVAVPIVSIEILGCPKAYLRLFLQPDRYTEWGWTLHRTAVQLWPTAEETP